VRSEHRKCVYEESSTTWDTSMSFAKPARGEESVKVYASLPGWDQNSDAIGSDNRIGRLLIQAGDEERNFVVETKAAVRRRFSERMRRRKSMRRAHSRRLDKPKNRHPVYIEWRKRSAGYSLESERPPNTEALYTSCEPTCERSARDQSPLASS